MYSSKFDDLSTGGVTMVWFAAKTRKDDRHTVADEYRDAAPQFKMQLSASATVEPNDELSHMIFT